MSRMNNKELKLSTLYFLSNPWSLTRRFSLEPLTPHSKIFSETFDPSLEDFFSIVIQEEKERKQSSFFWSLDVIPFFPIFNPSCFN